MWKAVRRLAAVVGTAVALLPVGAAAQEGRPVQERHTLEAYVADYQLADRIGTNKQHIGGFGLRLMFESHDPSSPSRSIADRTSGGVFATYTARQGSPNVSTFNLGLETDARFLQRPLGGVLDPFFSIGVGVLWTSRENLVTTTLRGHRIVQSFFAFTPAVGTRLGLVDRVGARVDLRAPLVFGTSTTANLLAEGGIYFTF